MCHSTWWGKTVRMLGKRRLLFDEKLKLVESIPAAMTQVSEEECNQALVDLKKALDTLTHALFVEYCWEHGQDETDEWTNSEAKALSDACDRVKLYLDGLCEGELRSDGDLL